LKPFIEGLLSILLGVNMKKLYDLSGREQKVAEASFEYLKSLGWKEKKPAAKKAPAKKAVKDGNSK